MRLKCKLCTIFATNIYARFIRFKFSPETQILMGNRKKRHILSCLLPTLSAAKL